MKIEVGNVQVIFNPETDMDMFYLGVISAKNKCHTNWDRGIVKSLHIKKEDLIVGLACKRD